MRKCQRLCRRHWIDWKGYKIVIVAKEMVMEMEMEMVMVIVMEMEMVTILLVLMHSGREEPHESRFKVDRSPRAKQATPDRTAVYSFHGMMVVTVMVMVMVMVVTVMVMVMVMVMMVL